MTKLIRASALVLCLCVFAAVSAQADTVGIFGDRPGDSASLKGELIALGHTVTNVGTLGALGPLGGYDTIWHVGAFAPLTAAEQVSLAAYLAGDGGLHLTGERPCCEPLNASIETLLNTVVAGGGITVGGLGDIAGPYTFNPGAIGSVTSSPNAIATWAPSAPGGLAGLGGLGSPSNILAKGAVTPVGAIFGESDLVGGKGRITLLMDVNWFSILGAADNKAAVDNLQVFLAGNNVVPEPGTLALVGLGAGFVLLRRRRRMKSA